MEVFQFWLVINSCIFMMMYFILFLLLKYSYKKSIFIGSISIIIIILLELLRIKFAFDVVVVKLVTTSLQIIIIQATALILAEKKNSYTLFLSLSSSNFVLGGNIFSCGILLFTKSYIAAMFVCTLSNLIVLIGIVYMIRDICKNIISKEVPWWMCIIPCMCYVTFYLLLYFPVSFEENPSSIFAAISLLLTMVTLYILLMKYLYVKLEEKQLLWKNMALNAYIKGIEIQSEEIEMAKKKFQVMRHDMRHKDNLLIELIHNQKYQEAEQVLYKDIEYLDKKRLVTYCENVMINSILCSMKKKAETMNITLNMVASVPQKQKMNDYELAMLVANLIENAIQAVEKLKEQERNIELVIKNIKGEKFFLEIKNFCDEKVEFSKISGLPISRKGEEHGFGMVSVQEFVKKYHAEFDCYIEDQIFVFRILINF